MQRLGVLLSSGMVFAACCAPEAGEPASAVQALLGDFAGELRLGPGLAPTVPMQLLVAPRDGQPDRYRFRLQYGEGQTADVRDYQLVLDDAVSGACHVDEGTGIELRGRLIDGELVTVFRVGDQVLDVRYRPVPDGIEFALASYDPATGEKTGAAAEGPPLRTFGEVVHQRALLRRR